MSFAIITIHLFPVEIGQESIENIIHKMWWAQLLNLTLAITKEVFNTIVCIEFSIILQVVLHSAITLRYVLTCICPGIQNIVQHCTVIKVESVSNIFQPIWSTENQI